VLLDIFAKLPEDRKDGASPAAGRWRYVVYGIVIESEIPLHSIEVAADATADAAISISLGPSTYFQARTRGLATSPDDWFHHAVLADGDVYIRADEIFEAVVSSDGRNATCARLASIDDRSFEANLLNFVLSIALTLRGEEPLHATVVDLDNRAVGLLGPSGAGKSTLAAFLIGQGATLITDDILRLTFADGRAFAHFGPHRLKLFDESAKRFLPGAIAEGHWNSMSGKIMIRPHASGPERRASRPLAAMFWLGEPDLPSAEFTVTSTRLAGIELARALTVSAMEIRYYAPDRLTRQMRFVERLTHVLPVFALRYARSYSLLEEVADEIRRQVQV
jgi:hypothetical protein